jgi:hypothetical protein
MESALSPFYATLTGTPRRQQALMRESHLMCTDEVELRHQQDAIVQSRPRFMALLTG